MARSAASASEASGSVPPRRLVVGLRLVGTLVTPACCVRPSWIRYTTTTSPPRSRGTRATTRARLRRSSRPRPRLRLRLTRPPPPPGPTRTRRTRPRPRMLAPPEPLPTLSPPRRRRRRPRPRRRPVPVVGQQEQQQQAEAQSRTSTSVTARSNSRAPATLSSRTSSPPAPTCPRTRALTLRSGDASTTLSFSGGPSPTTFLPASCLRSQTSTAWVTRPLPLSRTSPRGTLTTHANATRAPVSEYVLGDRFSPEFIERRRQE